MTKRTLFLASIVGAAFAAGLTVDHLAFAAQQQPSIKRTILQRQDDPASPKYEAIMGISEIPPGGTSGKHRHPGIELSYVFEGSVELTHEGKPPSDREGRRSDDEYGRRHSHRDESRRDAGEAPHRYVVEKGKPLAEAVP